MKVLFIFLFVPLIIACSSSGHILKTSDQCKPTYDSLTGMQIYNNVEVAPEYPGGLQESLLFFSKNFKYPNQDDFQGTVELEFIIDSSGKLVGERIRNKNMEQLTEVDKEALRVLRSMPSWIPGKCDNVAIPTITYLPVKF